MNFRERLEQSRGRTNSEAIINGELEEVYVCEYFATDNIKSLPACLDLRLSDGSRKALPYSSFIEIYFAGGEVIEIRTTTKKVTITGRDLERLYDYLVAYRVRYVTSKVGEDANEDGLFVNIILIEDL